MENNANRDRCQDENPVTDDHPEEISRVIDQLVETCSSDDCFDHVGPEPIPSLDAIVEIIHQVQQVLFPGYFVPARLERGDLRHFLAQVTSSLFEELSRQITLCIRHECLRHDLPCTHCEQRGRDEALKFLRELAGIRMLLAKDVKAAMAGDPAAGSYDEIIFCYPGLLATTVYRIAHQLHHQGVSLMPRIMSEYAHGLTGIDIHPGAHIGESFFVDHGSGVVIGETSDIGNRVRIYQGVTLGALSLPTKAVQRLRHKKRHPTIGDDVIIYAGATILGGRTVIGARSVIGGNVWLTESVPPDTTVFINKPDLVLKNGSSG